MIIDGRIADVAETGFLGGALIIPHFILAELQQVADSADSSKRQRGRRGLDMLQRLRNNSKLDVQIVETDFPQVKEVDLKLIELGTQLDAVIVTNDFNLNKVSQLRGVEVLNINELANALKPVVLPGEAMRVFILKEGKEYNQGVAYLDDGTMVVVDNARTPDRQDRRHRRDQRAPDHRGQDDLRPALGRKGRGSAGTTGCATAEHGGASRHSRFAFAGVSQSHPRARQTTIIEEIE